MNTTLDLPDMQKRNEAAVLFEALIAACKARDDAPDNSPDMASLDAAVEKAQDAYDDYDAPALWESYVDESKFRCAVTGIPCWEDDEVLEDSETGDIVLRAAIGLSPRPKEEASNEDEDETETA